MKYCEIKYKTNAASINSIIEHFEKCADLFNPPLYTYVNIKEYAKKIFTNAVTFEAWDGSRLVGLAAAYFNNLDEKIAFWTNLSVLDKYRTKGIAFKLTSSIIDYGIKNGFKRIDFEVNKINIDVIKFHKYHGAVVKGNKNEYTLMAYYL